MTDLRIDPVSGGVGLTGILGLIMTWFKVKRMRREDAKGDEVESGWTELVKGLREEVLRLTNEVKKHADELAELRNRCATCERDRDLLLRQVEDFKRSVGSRREGNAP